LVFRWSPYPSIRCRNRRDKHVFQGSTFTPGGTRLTKCHLTTYRPLLSLLTILSYDDWTVGEALEHLYVLQRSSGATHSNGGCCCSVVVLTSTCLPLLGVLEYRSLSSRSSILHGAAECPNPVVAVGAPPHQESASKKACSVGRWVDTQTNQSCRGATIFASPTRYLACIKGGEEGKEADALHQQLQIFSRAQK
jgi:hypothetical protein